MNTLSSDDAGNPFPRTAVASNSSQAYPNYFTASQAQAVELAQKFADQFAATGPSRPAAGVTFGIRGLAGSGKTHTIFQMRASLQRLQPTAKFVYAKTLESRNVLEFYRGVFPGDLTLDDFRNLTSQHYLKLLREQTRTEPSTTSLQESLASVAVRQADVRLRGGDQQYLLGLIEAELLPTAALKLGLDRDLQDTQKLLLGDLALAYSKVFDESYGADAVSWLRGNKLTEQQMKDLGLRSRIETLPDAHQALTFFLSAYRRAGVPLMLVVDEIERSVLTADAPDAVGRNLLKDLAEAMQASGHLFGVCGLTTAWDSVTPDFFGRFARTDIVEMRLTEQEATEIVRAWEGTKPSVFSSEALKLAVEAAEHNARRLLEIAHHSWENRRVAKEPTVLPEHVRNATRAALNDKNARQRAISAASGICEQQGLVIVESPFPEYDLAIGSEVAPLAFVKVTTSVFKDDEVADFRVIVKGRRRLAALYPAAGRCVVIAGYSSSILVEELRRDGDYVIRYDDETFSASFSGFLQRMREAKVVTLASSDDEDSKRYAAVEDKIEALAEQSKQQLEELRVTFQTSQKQKLQNIEERFETSSAEKLSTVIEQLTSALSDENLAWLKRGGEAARTKDDSRNRQFELVQYAKFLDRVVPGSNVGDDLEEYESYLVGRTPGEVDVRLNYERRLDLLRRIRQAMTRPTLWSRLVSYASLRNALAVLGVGGLVAYAASFFIAFGEGSSALQRYRWQLDKLQSFALQYRGWPAQSVPTTDFVSLFSGVTAARTEFGSTLLAQSPRGPSQLYKSLGDLSEALACTRAVSPVCSGARVQAAFDELARDAQKEQDALLAPSIAGFIFLYLRSTGFWALLAIALLVPYGLNRMMRGFRRPVP